MTNPEPQPVVEPQKHDEILTRLTPLLATLNPKHLREIERVILQLHRHVNDNEKADHVFYTNEDELEILARNWATEIKELEEFWEHYPQSDHAYRHTRPYACDRLNKIGVVIGEDRIDQIFEDVDQDRFRARIFQAARTDDNPPAPESKVYYTTHGRSIVFHHSRSGLRSMAGALEVPGDGWCWQKAKDFKTAKPVEHVGFATADAALESAQQAENAYCEEIKRKLLAWSGRR